MGIVKKTIFEKSVSAVQPMIVFAGIALTPVAAYASTTGLPDAGSPAAEHGRPDEILLFADIELPPASTNANMIMLPVTGNPGNGFGRPAHAPPANPPLDTPAISNGLVNTPVMMPASVPHHTLPGSGFGQSVVPAPAAVWLFGSGLLGLAGIARRKKTA